MSKEINRLAQAYAKKQLGPEQYDRNKDAVKGIVADFRAGYQAAQDSITPATRPAARRQLQPGDRVQLLDKHPWRGTTGTLVSYGPYGLDILKLEGWHVRLDENYGECYAQPDDLAPLPMLRISK